MKTNAYLTFNGRCAEAFALYKDLLGGKIETMLTHGETPAAAHVPADWKGKVMHAHLTFGDNALMGSDAPQQNYEKPQGVWVSLHVDHPAEAERIFNALAQGAEIKMPLGKTFWAERFGMLVDRFGIPWMVNCASAA
jgi:PhnB protein